VAAARANWSRLSARPISTSSYGELELPHGARAGRMEAYRRGARSCRPRRPAREFGDEIARLESGIYEAVRPRVFNPGQSQASSSKSSSTSSTCLAASAPRPGYSTTTLGPSRTCGRPPMIPMLLDWRRLHEAQEHIRRRVARCSSTRATRPPHTTFHQAVAATGRLLVRSEPPEHPIRVDLGRRASASLRGGELGTTLLPPTTARSSCASWPTCRDDAALKDCLRAARPTSTARRCRVAPTRTRRRDRDERSMAKMVNFGIAYGMSDFGFRAAAHSSRGAGAFINSYFRAIRASATTCSHQGRARSRLRHHAPGRPALDPRAQPRNPTCARQVSGWPSTCRSRAPPPTS
jgi:DNA polymerase-1